MTCIAGLVDLGGQVVARDVVARMVDAMKPRAPDGTELRIAGRAGLGQSLLAIGSERGQSLRSAAPTSHVFVVADARIDDREALVSRLAARGQRVDVEAPDVALVQAAYAAYGDAFARELTGDFAVALWDARRHALICARDHFGVRPLFHARTRRHFLVASEIEAILAGLAALGEREPQLDESAVGDFLLFGASQDATATIYRDIRRLPAASTLVLACGSAQSEAHRTPLALSRYWQMPRASLARLGDEREYVERFRELLSAAVRDRIRNADAVVQLSGGMDSTSVAALAAAHAPAQGTRLAAYTVTVDRLFPDEGEAWLAGTVAERLAIPLTTQPLARYALFDRASTPPLVTAEPLATPDLAVQYDSLAPIAQTSTRVLLSGQGGDAVFAGRQGLAAELVANRQWLTLLDASWRHYRALGTLRGFGLRGALLPARIAQRQRTAHNADEWTPRFPDWLHPDFVRRAALEDRWHAGWTVLTSASDAPRQLSTPWLSRVFEDYEALRLPVVARHPFFDIRVAMHVAAMPSYATANKRVLREAMRGRLPEAVRLRQKTALAGDPIRARLAAGRGRRAFRTAFARAGSLYVDRQRYRAAFDRYVAGEGGESTWTSSQIITPIALDNWLTEHGR